MYFHQFREVQQLRLCFYCLQKPFPLFPSITSLTTFLSEAVSNNFSKGLKVDVNLLWVPCSVFLFLLKEGKTMCWENILIQSEKNILKAFIFLDIYFLFLLKTMFCCSLVEGVLCWALGLSKRHHQWVSLIKNMYFRVTSFYQSFVVTWSLKFSNSSGTIKF